VDSSSFDPGEPVDVVYTWVDGASPGYPELLAHYSGNPHDLNPNRYRDNLDMLKYSIRSLVRFAPFFRNLHLVMTRPQLPDWLDSEAEGLRIVYHDEIFPEDHLPTFNSFAIVSNLYRVPGVSRRFLYLEDDRLFLRATTPADFMAPDGRLKLYTKWAGTDDGSGYRDERKSPWEAGLAYANHLLDERYGHRSRGSIKHTPVFFDIETFAEFVKAWPEIIEATSASRFRAMGNVPPEHMYPYYLLHEGRAIEMPKWISYRDISYLGIENWLFMSVFGLANLLVRRPKWYSLNDNFGDRPNPRVVALIRRYLESTYPEPSRFEKR
jgi:hypothetical protein